MLRGFTEEWRSRLAGERGPPAGSDVTSDHSAAWMTFLDDAYGSTAASDTLSTTDAPTLSPADTATTAPPRIATAAPANNGVGDGAPIVIVSMLPTARGVCTVRACVDRAAAAADQAAVGPRRYPRSVGLSLLACRRFPGQSFVQGAAVVLQSVSIGRRRTPTVALAA